MAERQITTMRAPMAWGMAAAFAILFVVLGLHFAGVQNVWIDESTQLLGSRLPLGTMIDWLAGNGPRLGVPDDRMPPVSYLVDSACWAAGCGGDPAFRVLHLLIATIAVVVPVHLAATRLGALPAVVTGALLVLSPQMTATAVEIRAYPLFLAVAAVELALFWRLVEGPALSARRLAPFWAVSVLGAYVHFFGLVMAGAYCAGLLVAKARTPRDVALVVATGVLILLPAAGLVPFIVGARAASDLQSAGGTGPAQVAMYLLRLLAGPESLVFAPLAALYFAGIAALLALSVWRIVGSGGTWADRLATPLAGVAAVIIAGIGLSVGGALVLKGFDPLKPTYSVWMLPALAILAAGGAVAARERLPHRAGQAAAVALVVALVGIAGVFWAHAAWFVHGPERPIAELVPAPAGDTAIVYDGPRWMYGFFPIVYRFGTGFPQYLRGDDGALRRIAPGGGVARMPATPDELDRYRHVVAVRIDLRSFRDLSRRLSGAPSLAPPPPVAPAGWTQGAERAVEGFYSARIVRFDKGDR